MPTLNVYRFLTIIILIALTASCGTQPTPNLPTAKSTDSPSTPLPALQPTQPSTSTQKPPRGTKSPKGGQNQGSDAIQNLSFDVPNHLIDVILGRPTDNSITVSLLSATSQTVSIAYGTEPGKYTSQTEAIALQANTPREITIANLTTNTSYFYSVNGIENTFHTARTPGSTFTFTIQADSHLDTNSSLPVYQQTLANESADQPDFVIDLGDTFMTDKYKPYTAAEPQYWAQHYYLSTLTQDAPLYLVLGNHDGEGAPKGQNGQEMADWAAKLRTSLFPNPIPDSFYTGNAIPISTVGNLQDYYAWEWGDALFVVLDPYRFTPPQPGSTTDLWNPTLGETQYQWLKTTLETSQAKWKFIFIHQLIGGFDKNGRGGVEVAPFYEWGGRNADGSYAFDEHRPGWGVPIHQLLVANNVTAVFHGHDHLFVKQELDGVIYQECPQPASARAKGTDSAAEYGYLNGDVLGSPGHLRITVAPSQVTVEYVRSYLSEEQKPGQQNQQVDYSYIIK